MAGSLGYAERLKNKRRLGGQLGAPEYFDAIHEVQAKVEQLASMIQATNKPVFVFTGAGISTSIGIPDFRGPNGIWTLKKRKQPITAPLTPFEHARPSFTHMAIAALAAAGRTRLVCSQNVDCLHLRSGVPRAALAEVHGNCFAERCSVCKTEYVRDFQVETLNFKPTGRGCTEQACPGRLHDNVLDWDSPLPEDELDQSIEAAAEAGVALVLGSSLQIAPANEIPDFTPDAGGSLVIVNLQKTPSDKAAALLVRAYVDPVMALLTMRLGLTVSPYLRIDGVAVCHAVDSSPPATQTGSDVTPDASASLQSSPPWGCTLLVRSAHGAGCLMPMVEAVTVRVQAQGVAAGGAGGVHVWVRRVRHPSAGGTGAAETESSDAGARQGQEATAASPAHSGGVPLGGPYEFAIMGIPAHCDELACFVSLRLVQWADPSKRHVALPVHTIRRWAVEGSRVGLPRDADVWALVRAARLPTLPCQAPPGVLQSLGFSVPAPSSTGDAGAKESPVVQRTPAAIPLGPEPRLAASGAGGNAALYTFFTQETRHDAAAVWAAYAAAPPSRAQPEPPKPRAPSSAAAKLPASKAYELAAAAEGVQLRRSGRQRTPSAFALCAGEGTSSSGGSSDRD